MDFGKTVKGVKTQKELLEKIMSIIEEENNFSHEKALCSYLSNVFCEYDDDVCPNDPFYDRLNGYRLFGFHELFLAQDFSGASILNIDETSRYDSCDAVMGFAYLSSHKDQNAKKWTIVSPLVCCESTKESFVDDGGTFIEKGALECVAEFSKKKQSYDLIGLTRHKDVNEQTTIIEHAISMLNDNGILFVEHHFYGDKYDIPALCKKHGLVDVSSLLDSVRDSDRFSCFRKETPHESV